MDQRLILTEGDTDTPEEKTFQKVNTMFLDLLKNPNRELSDISEESENTHQTREPLFTHPLSDNSDRQSIFVKVKPKTVVVKRLAEITGKQPTVSPPTTIHETKETTTNRKAYISFQYELLRKLYPDANIPPLNPSASLRELESEYDSISRRIEMATTIDKSKKIFVLVLLGSELLLGKLGLDMAGFTLDQLNNMESYNSVLYELGKKYAIFTESKIEPELKLIGLLVFSILAHLVTRSLETSGSETIAGIVQQSTKHTFKHLFG